MKMAAIMLAALMLGDAVSGAAAAAERRFTLSAFDKVRIEGDVAVEILSDAPPFAVASGDPRAIEALSVKVQGGTVYIRRARRNAPVEQRNRRAGADALPLVRLSARAVQSLTVLGHGSTRIDRLAGATPSATMDGDGSVEVGSVMADAVALNVHGSGSLKIGGTAARARAVMLGQGRIEAGGLMLDEIDFIGEGPVRAALTVNGPARIAVKGDADVQIGGKPVCTIRQTGTNAIACGAAVPVR